MKASVTVHLRLIAVLLVAATGVARAEELRDPTQWPLGVQTANAASTASNPASGAEGDPAAQRFRQIIIVEGQAYLVAGARRYGVGAMLGDAKIMRIDAQAVWLRDASGTRREALYPGIEKRAVSTATTPSTASTSPKPAAASANKKTTRTDPSVGTSAQEKS